MQATTLLQRLTNPREFIRNWLEQRKVSVRADGSLTHKTPRHKLFLTIWLDYEEQRRAYNGTCDPRARIGGAGKETLADALDELITLDREAKVAAIAAHVAFTGDNLQPLEQFVEAVTGKTDTLAAAALAHFIWMIKRKLNGMNVTWHLMPILQGIQGVGKSTAIKELLKPVADVTTYLKLDELSDSRCAQALEQNYVIVCDELMGAARTEIETLKNRVTADVIGLRPMRSNDIVNLRVNASFIGSTNNDIATMIRDSSGMRRFLNIMCQDQLMTGIYNVDVLSLWRGIDEKRSVTYLDAFKSELATAQKELETPSEVQLFLDAFGLYPTEEDKGVKHFSTSLYGSFKQWAEQNGYKPINATHFGRQLKLSGIQSLKTSSRGCALNYYVISGAGLNRLTSDVNRMNK
jgi:hypothetical protein